MHKLIKCTVLFEDFPEDGDGKKKSMVEYLLYCDTLERAGMAEAESASSMLHATL